jgi:transposase InsO family protein
VLREVIDLIHRMSLANPGWGAPRIHGQLLKLEFELSQATVAKYLVRHRRPPSQNWRTFLKNHMQSLVSADFFVVPTITFRLVCLPTAEWTTRQLLEAFPWDSGPRYLLRDRHGSYGEEFHEATAWLGIREVLTAPRSPWQNPYVERLIGTIRRECWTTSSLRSLGGYSLRRSER